MRAILAFLTCAAVALSIGCGTTTANKATDADMERSIQALLEEDPVLQKISVDADVETNAAELSGTVYSQQQRAKAVELAKLASPGLVVTDKIDVKPAEAPRSDFTDEMAREARARAAEAGEKIGESLDDAWIHTKVTAKLLADGGISATRINVDVERNVVTLRGEARSADRKSEAETIAKNTEGVTRVVNRIFVKGR